MDHSMVQINRRNWIYAIPFGGKSVQFPQYFPSTASTKGEAKIGRSLRLQFASSTGAAGTAMAYEIVLHGSGSESNPPTRTIRFWFCSKRYPAATGRTDCPFCSPLYPILRRARNRPVPSDLRAVSRYRSTGKVTHWPRDVLHKKRRTRPFCSRPPPRERRLFPWWAHQGSNLGPAD
jgi:hypothetical protein